jgi:hypothetical protein
MPNPNTTFTSGAVYTADQANRFPRGVMAITTSTSNTISGGYLTGLNTSFTAVANRLYRITVNISASAPVAGSRVIITVNGCVCRLVDYTNAIASFPVFYGSSTQTYSAGVQNLQVLWFNVAGSTVANGGTGNAHQLIVEDLGPS